MDSDAKAEAVSVAKKNTAAKKNPTLGLRTFRL
jgi:hypothetical protein